MVTKTRNCEIEIVDLNIEVHSTVSHPPERQFEEIIHWIPGKAEGYVDEKGKPHGYYKPPQAIHTGSYQEKISLGQWVLDASINGHVCATVVCEHCQHQYAFPYEIHESRNCEHTYSSGVKARTQSFLGKPIWTPLVESELWERLTTQLITEWRENLEKDIRIEIKQGAPPFHKCPMCGRPQAFMIPDLSKKVISSSILLMLILGGIIGLVNPGTVGLDISSLCFPLNLMARLLLMVAGGAFGVVVGALTGAFIMLSYSIYTKIAYKVPIQRDN